MSGSLHPIWVGLSEEMIESVNSVRMEWGKVQDTRLSSELHEKWPATLLGSLSFGR